VVAEHADRTSCDKLVDHATCVRPTVTNVTDDDHRRAAQLREQPREQVGAPVYITDDGDRLVVDLDSELDQGSVPTSVDATRA